MGSSQTKEEHNSSNSLIAQTVNNTFQEKLDSLVWVIIALVAILSAAIGLMVCRRCKRAAEFWVRKQTSCNPSTATVQTVPPQQAPVASAYV
ncbi:unnamed protein product, partial [Iphiclides podalirius]